MRGSLAKGVGESGQKVRGRWGYSFRPTSGKREASGLTGAGKRFAVRLVRSQVPGNTGS